MSQLGGQGERVWVNEMLPCWHHAAKEVHGAPLGWYDDGQAAQSLNCSACIFINEDRLWKYSAELAFSHYKETNISGRNFSHQGKWHKSHLCKIKIWAWNRKTKILWSEWTHRPTFSIGAFKMLVPLLVMCLGCKCVAKLLWMRNAAEIITVCMHRMKFISSSSVHDSWTLMRTYLGLMSGWADKRENTSLCLFSAQTVRIKQKRHSIYLPVCF